MKDHADKNWLDRLNASLESGWLVFAGCCAMATLAWLLVIYVPR